MVVRVIDIETTGTDPEQDAVIEIASVDVLADGTITNQVSTLVRPAVLPGSQMLRGRKARVTSPLTTSPTATTYSPAPRLSRANTSMFMAKKMGISVMPASVAKSM
jgi:hypothetical protein